MTKRILFICGSINQTSQMHQIAEHLTEAECSFTPYYADGLLALVGRSGLADSTILGRKLHDRCLSYLKAHDLPLDLGGRNGPYDLVVTCSDLIIPHNIRDTPTVLVQEGMTDPENLAFHLVRMFPFLPRWIASTSTTGLSRRYDRFCVASPGYRELFIRKGAPADRLVVTGMPNFDNCARYLLNSFPYSHYALVCTSDMRETFKWENRKKFLLKAVELAGSRPLIIRLHPNEDFTRARREIERYAPGALVLNEGNTEEMIANCDVLITRLSSTVFVGLALGKECYSDFDVKELKRLLPLQHGEAAENIAGVCREMLSRESSRASRDWPLTVKVKQDILLEGGLTSRNA